MPLIRAYHEDSWVQRENWEAYAESLARRKSSSSPRPLPSLSADRPTIRMSSQGSNVSTDSRTRRGTRSLLSLLSWIFYLVPGQRTSAAMPPTSPAAVTFERFSKQQQKLRRKEVGRFLMRSKHNWKSNRTNRSLVRHVQALSASGCARDSRALPPVYTPTSEDFSPWNNVYFIRFFYLCVPLASSGRINPLPWSVQSRECPCEVEKSRQSDLSNRTIGLSAE